ncbi:MAG: thioredoxin domain-containing protein [Deltaproteobacteria bacterium]|nr:thioredoxin domain-containing protein [Deltaproteobacteria bacterium]
MKKENIILATVAVAVVGFVAARFAMQDKPAPAQPTAKAPAEPAAVTAPTTSTAARYPATGPDDAKVTIVEISDYQCPFCSRAAETVKKVAEKYPKDVRVVFVNLPLSFHKDARPAAIAAMAAGRQGKYWPMHEKLFEHQRELTRDNFLKWAAELGLDATKFQKDLADPELAKHVDVDTAIANGLGVTGTPGFFINGVRLSGAQPIEKFVAAIDEQITKANDAIATGAKPHEVHARMWRTNSPSLAENARKWLIDGQTPPPAAPPAPAAEKKPEKDPADDKTVWKVELTGEEPVSGPADALVTLVEFTDFQCPFCSKVRPTLEEVKKAYEGKLRLVFKNQPLSFHKNAQIAAEASLCAHKQGKFWEMEERLFTNQQTLAREQLPDHAKAVGLDLAAFETCLDKHETKEAVAADQATAEKVTATGTPAFFINGRKISGAQPLDAFRRLVDEELAKAKAMVAAGTKPSEVYAKAIAAGKQELPPPVLGESVNTFAIDGSPVYGDPGAPIKVVVFKDFECPFCGRVSMPLKAAALRHEGKVAIVFKHFPLSSQCNRGMGRDMHPGACQSAYWSFAALEQGKFHAFEDIVFNNFRTMMPRQGDLSVRLAAQAEKLMDYAKEIGMDVAKAQAFVKSGAYKPKLDRDIAEAARAGVQGTPAVYINGRVYNGKMTPDGFAEVFGQILAGKL